ncbi:MAG: hypothetical protein CXX83_00265 [Methanobacteriota archaeon]|uniref:Uncharacterized protein n=1 Tax=uncultured marine group II/III euryarchaeote KM3_149_A03 TaxID=1457884 RepID=A0A075GHV8_9EURY|nr:hypothetical protein [uncultured marine group II/III euryarchaeote KM3_149_A03]PXY70831.1 MAG: hypothetical protein CXX83_02105 [Euryarchaeota archaeon]PXY71203.1 MAG: hypothetical protein CXX83_00265 [Euryarchaeota archaeon]
MQTCIVHLLGQPHIDAPTVRSEVDFLEQSLTQLRHDGSISNDAYLDAGAIEGGLAMLANLLDLGIPTSEVQEHLRQLHERAGRIHEAHPTLDGAVEARRR